MKFEKGDIVVLKSNLYTFITIVDDRLAVPYAEYKMIKCSYCIHNMNSTNYEWLDINKEVFYKEVYEPTWHQIKLFKDALAKENKYYCEKTKTIKEMKKEFTKKDLKSGMWAKTRNGNTYIIIENMTTQLYGTQKFCLIGDGSYVISDSINNDLTYASNKEFDIIGLYGNILGFGNRFTFSFDKQTLIWERETEEDKQIKEMETKLSEMRKAYDELEENITSITKQLKEFKR